MIDFLRALLQNSVETKLSHSFTTDINLRTIPHNISDCHIKLLAIIFTGVRCICICICIFVFLYLYISTKLSIDWAEKFANMGVCWLGGFKSNCWQRLTELSTIVTHPDSANNHFTFIAFFYHYLLSIFE